MICGRAGLAVSYASLLGAIPLPQAKRRRMALAAGAFRRKGVPEQRVTPGGPLPLPIIREAAVLQCLVPTGRDSFSLLDFCTQIPLAPAVEDEGCRWWLRPQLI